MHENLAADIKQKFEVLYDEPLTAQQRWQAIAEALWAEWNAANDKSS